MFKKEKRVFFVVLILVIAWIIIATGDEGVHQTAPYGAGEFAELAQIEERQDKGPGKDIETLYQFLLSSQTLFTILFVFVMMVLVVAYLTVWMLLFLLFVKK